MENDVALPIEWRENFRKSKENFGKLCEAIAPDLERQRTKPSRARNAIPVRKEVAMTLYYLRDEGRLRKLPMPLVYAGQLCP